MRGELRVPPWICIFPRSRSSLFQVPGGDARLQYMDRFGSYKYAEGNSFPETVNGSRGIKEIETRIYLDLWNNVLNTEGGAGGAEPRHETTTKKKMTLGFLCIKDREYTLYNNVPRRDIHPWLQKENLCISLKVDPGNTGRSVTLNIRQISSNYRVASGESAIISVRSMAPGYLAEFDVEVADSTSPLPENLQDRIIKVTAKLGELTGRGGDRFDEINGTETRIDLELYRLPADTQDGGNAETVFGHYGKNSDGYDHDFFVLPRINPEREHEPYIKRLQFLSNQVIARNRNVNGFQFLAENGTFDTQLGQNINISIDAFQKTKTESEHEKLLTVFPYDLSKYGQEGCILDEEGALPPDCFLKQLAYEYHLSINLSGIVLDRHFLFGNVGEAKALGMGDEPGLETLYKCWVLPFRQAILEEALRYVNFGQGDPNKRWLSRPSWNRHYRRGNLMIERNLTNAEQDMRMVVYGDKTGNTQVSVCGENGDELWAAGDDLPDKAVISFAAGSDEYDYDVTNPHRYKVSSIQIPQIGNNPGGTGRPKNGQSWFIPLTYEDKLKCNDREINGNELSQNFCDYIDEDSFPPGMTQADKDAIIRYGRQIGVPYYISPLSGYLNGNKGGRIRLDRFEQSLTMPAIRNWYSYGDRNRPNAPSSFEGATGHADLTGVGLDCSGLVLHCFLGCLLHGGQDGNFFQAVGNNFLYNENVAKIGERRLREFPPTLITGEGMPNTPIQSGDLIYKPTKENTPGHIAFCALGDGTNVLDYDAYIRRTQVTENHIEKSNFNIIHNYGTPSISWINYTSQQPSRQQFNGGFFQKTLYGLFRHWNIAFDSGETQAKAGRIYLWY